MKICFILNEYKEVFHSELDSKPCSGTLSSALRLISGLSGKYEVLVFHRGAAKRIGRVEYKNLADFKTVGFNYEESWYAIFVGAAGSYITKECSIFTGVYYWLHNYERLSDKKELLDNGVITKVVCVSYYQMFTMIKSGVFFKSTCIHNIYDQVKKNVKIAFVGSLTKAKGLHNLIKIWKKLTSKDICVELHIFGSGDMYSNTEFVPGITGVVDKNYEASFIKDIYDNKALDRRVKFYGLKTKSEILPVVATCDYFISGLNEIGAAECFSIAFLEAQDAGTPVLTLNRGGQKESLYLEGSKAFNNHNEVISYIANKNITFEKLSTNNIVKEWELLFQNKRSIGGYFKSLYYGVSVTSSKMIARLKLRA